MSSCIKCKFGSSCSTKQTALAEAGEAGRIVKTKNMCPGVMVALAVCPGIKLQPFFVEQGVKINAAKWVDMLNVWLLPLLHAGPRGFAGYEVVMDNAPSHMAGTSLAWHEEAKLRWCAQPPNSPDLNLLDFWAWSRLEQIMLEDVPGGKFATLHELRGAVVRACDKVSADELKKAHESIVARCRMCISEAGSAFEELARPCTVPCMDDMEDEEALGSDVTDAEEGALCWSDEDP